MMRLSVQLEMGMFSATVCGLTGVAFGMNLDSYLEEVRICFTTINVIIHLPQTPYAFWFVTGTMIGCTGLLWRRLLKFLGKNLNRSTKLSLDTNLLLEPTKCKYHNERNSK